MGIFNRLFLGTYKNLLIGGYCVISAIGLLVSIYTDISFRPPMPPDLRNRVVGSRMLKDGQSPYFYIWQKGGPVRYYDIHTAPNENVSRATATPFFHQATQWVADMPQHSINILWMCIEYILWCACVLVALFSVPIKYRNFAWLPVTAVAVLFTYTIGWRMHVLSGQNYIFIPLLVMACYRCTANPPFTRVKMIMFGIFAASLILIWPASLLFFLPFLFFIKLYYKLAAATVTALILYGCFVAVSPVLRLNWSEYFKSVTVHVSNHQGLSNIPPIVYDSIPIKQFEGINLAAEPNKQITIKLAKACECSNFFVYYNQLAGTKLSVKSMELWGALFCVALLLPLLVYIKKGINVSSTALLLLGFVVYDVGTFFSPIVRNEYHFVPFLFPLLVVAATQRNILAVPVACLVAGLLLNTMFWHFIPAIHTLGEFVILGGLLLKVYGPLLPGSLIKNRG